ncbi:thioredoxin reductase 1, cytoplasmic isoform 1 [Planoprotostelium fungivorum]|uniref:thioredoxin-disulfide reductase (NADPH) n=1 Tax=Planoprotostelium fungivorum TaxID=1890364 RepID=A0A2P6N2K8_9EUKA|nr:thioredoxin reductase 1, cytoplasmic isoform 1 [Planoprotostelium fungivorum]
MQATLRTVLKLQTRQNFRRFQHSYDYDLIVIGGGSGGLATAQEAARLTEKNPKKIAVLDFVKPTPSGSTWGLGGTCVNVGCIPKKLMHQASIVGKTVEDSESYGWNIAQAGPHDWKKLVENVQNHVKSLNFGYRTALRSSRVDYLNMHGRFTDEHTIEAVDRLNNARLITSDKFLIAVGGRPKMLDIPGKEYCITSDDIFNLRKPPGKTLVIGASYVALECAGFLHGLGSDTTVMSRSIFLRGFDQQMAQLVVDHMQGEGVRFIRDSTPIAVEKLEHAKENAFRVTHKHTNGRVTSEDYNTVLMAVGRQAQTSSIGLDSAGVKFNIDTDGKIPVVEESTNVPHIYALGDVITGNTELTPVAIRAGRLLARRLFGGKTEMMDYTTVPTTVFTPLEYSACGMTEEEATNVLGRDNIEVYHTYFTPLEWTLPHRNSDQCYMKCIVGRDDKIVGLHILGPNSGEIMQGFAVAMKAGATMEHLRGTVSIHPTVAEGDECPWWRTEGRAEGWIHVRRDAEVSGRPWAALRDRDDTRGIAVDDVMHRNLSRRCMH